ncbi:MAG TPA: hypothetical protein VFG01_05840 [Acidobacteriota bacterium]|nr:hypothetical protein [Acidobacteriota bacterium]
MPRWLENLDISEISLVDKAANKKKRFHVIKENKMNYIELIQKFFEEKADSDKVDLKKFMEDEEIKEALEEDEDILAMLEKAEKLPKNAMTALKGAYKTLSKYKDDFTSELKKALKTISKYVSYGYPEKSDTEKVAKFDVENLTEKAIEKAGRALSKATVAQLKKMREMLDKLIGDKEKKEKADGLDKIPEDVKKKLDDYEKLKKEKEDEEKERTEKLEEENAKLKKKLAKKKSIDDQDDEDDEDVEKDEGDKWPSLG